MTRVMADKPATVSAMAIAEASLLAPALNPAARRVLAELELWWGEFAPGRLRPQPGGPPALAPGERFAGRRAEVRAAGGGHPSAAGTLHATDRRALVVGTRAQTLREWAFGELAAVSALGNWGGLALVHPGGDTELVVTAALHPPTWQDATGWLTVEAAFAAGAGRLDSWMAELPRRLAVTGEA